MLRKNAARQTGAAFPHCAKGLYITFPNAPIAIRNAAHRSIKPVKRFARKPASGFPGENRGVRRRAKSSGPCQHTLQNRPRYLPGRMEQHILEIVGGAGLADYAAIPEGKHNAPQKTGGRPGAQNPPAKNSQGRIPEQSAGKSPGEAAQREAKARAASKSSNPQLPL